MTAARRLLEPAPAPVDTATDELVDALVEILLEDIENHPEAYGIDLVHPAPRRVGIVAAPPRRSHRSR